MGAEQFEITVRGDLDVFLLDELDGFEIVATRPGQTRLRGIVPDQARLVGLLNLLRGFNVDIESVIHLA